MQNNGRISDSFLSVSYRSWLQVISVVACTHELLLAPLPWFEQTGAGAASGGFPVLPVGKWNREAEDQVFTPKSHVLTWGTESASSKHVSWAWTLSCGSEN